MTAERSAEPRDERDEREALAQGFREALARWASGVTVVTARDDAGAPAAASERDDGAVYGVTASSFTSVSLAPPLVLVCLAHSSRTLPVLQRLKRFTVNLLASDQRALSDWFADRPGVTASPRFGRDGELEGAAASLVCDLWQDYPGGDHRILVGEVRALRLGAASAPLLYWQRRYRALADE